MFWWILLFLFLWLLVTLLFAPLKLSLSTTNNLYFVSWGGAIKASASILHDDIEVRFHLFGFSKGLSVMQMAAGYTRKKSIPEKVADQVVKTTKKRVPANLIVAFLKSFRVKKFYINIDWGSVYWNAWLYPLGEIFYKENVYITTNFSGKTDVEVVIVNRPANMFWAVAKSVIKTKKR
jgi:hypothetical protein